MSIYLACMIITKVAYCHIDRYDYLSHTVGGTEKDNSNKSKQYNTIQWTPECPAFVI